MDWEKERNSLTKRTDSLHRVFERTVLAWGNTTERLRDATGLSLSAVADRYDMFEGDITLYMRLNKGQTFKDVEDVLLFLISLDWEQIRTAEIPDSKARLYYFTRDGVKCCVFGSQPLYSDGAGHIPD